MLQQIHYGWVMVILAMCVTIVYAMAYYIFGIFLIPVTMEFGWERGALSVALSMAMLVGGAFGIPAGRLSDKYGPRPLVTVSGLLTGIALLLMSQVSLLWHVYLIWGLIMGMAFSCCVIPISTTIPRWFTSKRGIAIGLTAVGGGLGGVIWPPVAQWLISSFGWRYAYVALGLMALVIVVPVAQFMRHSPQRVGLKPYGENKTIDKESPTPVVEEFSFTRAMKASHFWIFSLISFCFQFSIRLIMIHIAPHAVDIGILAMVAASIPSIIAVFNLTGKLTLGFMADRIGSRLALITCLCIFILAMIWLLCTKELWMFYVFAVIFGIAYGGEILVFTLVPAELFGLRYLGTIAATIRFLGTIGGASGPPFAGKIFDVTGSYNLAFLISLILSAVALILSLILLRSKRSEEVIAIN
ncbi:MFS transporter [Chloroflexota bacterium]